MVEKPTISLCMVTHNDKKVLPRSLDSVRGFVDEVIIMDRHSDDGTADLARELGAAVYQTSWTNNYWTAFIETIKKARGNYVLLLDPNEELIFPQDCSLESYLKQPAKGYFLPVHNNLWRIEGNEPWPWYAMRLIKTASAGKEEGRQGVVIPELRVRQFAADFNVEEMVLRLKRNLLMLTRNLPSDLCQELRQWHDALESFALGDYDGALKQMQNCGQFQVYPNIYNSLASRYMAKCMSLSNCREETIPYLDRAINKYKDYPDLYFIRGKLYLKQHRMDKAYGDIQKCLSLRTDMGNYVLEEGVSSYKPLYFRGLINECQYDYEKAIADYIEVLRTNPDYLPALSQMVKILNPRKYPEYTVECLSKIFDFSTPEANLRLAQALYLQGAYREALKYTYVADSSNPLCVKAQFVRALCLLRTRSYFQAAREFQGIPEESYLYEFALSYLVLSYWLQKYHSKARITLKQAEQRIRRRHLITVLNNLLDGEAMEVPRGNCSNESIEDRIVPGTAQKFAEEILGILMSNHNWSDLELVIPKIHCFFSGGTELVLAKCYHRHGFSDKALEQLEQLSIKGIEEPEAYLLMGLLYRRKKDYQKAMGCLEDLQRSWPGHPRVYLELAVTYQCLSLDKLQQGSERFPDSQALQLVLQKSKETLNNLEEMR